MQVGVEKNNEWERLYGRDPDDGESKETSFPPAVAGLVSSLKREKLYREVSLALRTGLRDAQANFSFLRLRGLRSILSSLRLIANSDSAIRIFRHTQSIPDLQVVPVLFGNTLRQSKSDPVINLDCIFSVEPMQITSPATDSEVTFALRVLEGCCLLNEESSVLAHQQKATKVLLHILLARSVVEQSACLDALVAVMLDSAENQRDFEACRGIDRITELMKKKLTDENIRLKCAEFLLLLIGHVNVRDRPPMANIHSDMRRLLGEKCASLIRAASEFGSTLDPEQRLTALNIQARRVLESLDFY